MSRTAKKHMSKQDIEEFDELYEYVRSNVLGYDKNQSLSRNMVLRLKGLANNKYIANNNIKDTANYSFKTILLTFKFCMRDIQKGLANNSFRDETHKFNYIMKIVESNLNDVYMRMKNLEKSKQKTKNVDIDIVVHNGAAYQNKTKQASERLNDLW